MPGRKKEGLTASIADTLISSVEDVSRASVSWSK